jgi:hypothetical protein
LVNRLDANDFASSTGCEWGDKAADENRALTPILAGDGGVSASLPCRRHRLQSSVAHSCCSGGNPTSGFPRSDNDDALTSLYLLRSSFLDQRWLVVARGGVVLFNRIADDESQRHGAAGSRCWSRLDWLAQDGGTFWRHGGIDGRPGKGFRFGLTP